MNFLFKLAFVAYSLAFQAYAISSRSNTDIVGAVVMTAKTLGTSAFGLSASFLRCGVQEQASSGVFAVRNGLQVLRVDAAPNPAQVVNFQTIRYRTSEKFVRGAMSSMHRDIVMHAKFSVSGVATVPHPKPTSAIWLRRNLRHKSLSDILSSSHLSTPSAWFDGACAADTVAGLSHFIQFRQLPERTKQ